VVDAALLSRWRGLLIGSALCAGVLAALYVLIAPPAYRAEVRVVIQNLGLGTDAGSKPTYDKEFLSTQAEVIRSPTILLRALQILPPHPQDRPKDPPDPVADLSEALQVNLLAGTDIVRITFEHSDPQYAADRLKSIIDSFKEHARSVEQTSTSQSVDLLTVRERELQKQLQTLQQRSMSLRSDAAVTTTNVTVDESPLLRELTNRWVAVESGLAAAESKLAGGAGYAANLVDSPASRELAELENQSVAARLDAAKAEKIYGPAHPERISAEQRAINLTREVEGRRTQVLSGLGALRDALSRERDQLQTMMARETERLHGAHSARLEHEQVQAEIGQLSEIHVSTAKALEAVRLADRTLAVGRTSILINVLDEFVAPREVVWPKPIPLISVAVLLGLMSGLGLAVVLESRGNSPTAGVVLPQETVEEFIPAEPNPDQNPQRRFSDVSWGLTPEVVPR